MRCGQEDLQSCVAHAHNLVKWDSVCKERRVMYKTCLVLQADFFYFVEMKAKLGTSGPKRKRAERTDANGETHPEPLNGLLNAVARFEVSRLNQGQPLYGRVAIGIC